MSDKSVQMISVDKLLFDRKNPRLAEHDIKSGTEKDEIVSILWNEMDVMELTKSISASGFFPHEQLIVIPSKNGKYTVIEGNRRLAAITVLLERRYADENGWDVPVITEELKQNLLKLPVFVESREKSWRFLGFKHVNGPAKWSSYAKAKYISDVHNDYKVPLADIARQIGDGHRTVQRLYRGLMVLEQAEREKVFDRDDRYRSRLAFSHLYTGLDYDGIGNFLSLKDANEEDRNPIPNEKLSELGEICNWLYGSKKQRLEPLIQRQNPNLRQLDAVTRSRGAMAALRDTRNLEQAFEISQPANTVLEQALLRAKRDLQKVQSYLTTGYDKSEELLRVAGSVANIADAVYNEMERMRNPEHKKRVSED